MTPGQPKLWQKIYSIPNLQFDDLATHLNFFGGELNSHGGIAVAIELGVVIAGEQRAFTHRGIANQNVLEQIIEFEAVFHYPYYLYIYTGRLRQLRIIYIPSTVQINFLSMLPRYLARLLATISDKKIPISTSSPSVSSPSFTKSAFRIKLGKISDPIYFMEIINNHHPLKETNRMVEVIADGGTALNRHNFETIFKKYCYYIEKIPKSLAYGQASFQEKLKFLNAVTAVYSKFGHLSTAQMLKTFNKIADELYKQLSFNFAHAKSESLQRLIQDSILVVLSVGRYNKKKSFAMMKILDRYLKSSSFLLAIKEKSAIYYLQASKQLSHYNRLVFEVCLDALKDRLLELGVPDFLNVLYSVAASQYPINHYYAQLLIKRATHEFRKKNDSTTGRPVSPSAHSLRQSIRMLESLSLIEANMKLASSYLPDFTQLLEIQLYEISAHLSRMNDKDLRDYANMLRRVCYYDENLLLQFAAELTQRGVRQLQNLDFEGLQQPHPPPHQHQRLMSMDTFASSIHALAVYNYRYTPVVEYFIESANLMQNMSKLKGEAEQEKEDEKESIRYIFQPKHYGRVIWSMCVLGTKEQLARMYAILEPFFGSQQSASFPFYDTLNLYYCYLLLKAYLPLKNISFQPLLQHLEEQHLVAEISETHLNMYKTFVQAGIAALKQHNVSNLMCDIFVPRYETSDQYLVCNVIIDLHGHHHFMRNCDRLKGGNSLKAKILSSEGYLYQYVGVEEWALADDKKGFVRMLMDDIARKFGDKQLSKVVSNPHPITQNLKNSSVQLHAEQITTPIPTGCGRRVKTNSKNLQLKLNAAKLNQKL